LFQGSESAGEWHCAGTVKPVQGAFTADFLHGHGPIFAMASHAPALGLILHIAVNQRTSTRAPFFTNTGMHEMKFFLTILAAGFLFTAAWAAEPVNVNTASAEEISENLKGIGLSKASLIIEYREANGNFLHVDELVNVKGIGIKTVDRNRGMILLQDEETPMKN
jgi:competence protein ComEA